MTTAQLSYRLKMAKRDAAHEPVAHVVAYWGRRLQLRSPAYRRRMKG